MLTTTKVTISRWMGRPEWHNTQCGTTQTNPQSYEKPTKKWMNVQHTCNNVVNLKFSRWMEEPREERPQDNVACVTSQQSLGMRRRSAAVSGWRRWAWARTETGRKGSGGWRSSVSWLWWWLHSGVRLTKFTKLYTESNCILLYTQLNKVAFQMNRRLDQTRY